MSNPIQTEDKDSLAGRKFRFVVSSAEEAVTSIREHLGPNAKVLSVNQVGGKGLSRFLSSPKLEVIATVPLESASEDPNTSVEMERVPSSSNTLEVPSAASTLYPDINSTSNISENSEIKTFERPYDKPGQKTLTNILQDIGFDSSWVAGIPEFESLKTMPVAQGMSAFIKQLRLEYERFERKPLTDKIAFLGSPSSGKTTALCKQISHDVFINKKQPQVMKFDAETANSSEALSVFCDVLGVEFLRDPIDSDHNAEAGHLYVDLPGINLSDKNEWARIEKKLDALEVDTRVWVINAAYDEKLIEANMELGQKLEATHYVFSHCDEVLHIAKLWPYLFGSGLSPMFLSHGQNLTSDFSENTLEYLLEKTFPAIVNS